MLVGLVTAEPQWELLHVSLLAVSSLGFSVHLGREREREREREEPLGSPFLSIKTLAYQIKTLAL